MYCESAHQPSRHSFLCGWPQIARQDSQIAQDLEPEYENVTHSFTNITHSFTKMNRRYENLLKKKGQELIQIAIRLDITFVRKI